MEPTGTPSSASGKAAPKGTRAKLEAGLKAARLADPAKAGTPRERARAAARRAKKLGAAYRPRGRGSIGSTEERARKARRGMNLRELIRTVPGWDPDTQAEDTWFDEAAAWRFVDFVHSHLTHTKGALAGKPLLLEPWQVAIVANIFGWKRPDGTRRFREVFIYVPRKNGKSTLAAAIILYLLACDGERGAEVYSAAGSKEQAALIWSVANGMIENRAGLKRRLRTFGGPKSIVYAAGASTYKAIPADARLQHGFNAHGVVVDEVHVLPDGELVDVLTSSQGARAQPLTVYITTADFDRPSVCNELLASAKAVRDNKGDRDREGWDTGFMPVIYEASTDDDWRDPRVWQAANPGLGTSLRPEYVEREVTRALHSPRRRNTFLRLQLNVRTQAEVAWVPMELWDGCAGKLKPAELLGRRCIAGVDVAFRKDLAVLALYFPAEHAILARAWWPEQNLRRRVRDEKADWMLEWVENGYGGPVAEHGGPAFLELTKGGLTDLAVIGEAVKAAAKAYEIQALGFDPWNARELAQGLARDGVKVAEVRQTYRDLSEPTKELEGLWIDRKLQHFGNPVLRWCAGNTMVLEDHVGNIKPDKARSSGQIDGIVATIIAMAVARVLATKDPGPSVYETRGIVSL